MKDGPMLARPGFVSLLPGGRQEFPNDPIADQHRDKRVRNEAARLGRKLTRRIPKESQ